MSYESALEKAREIMKKLPSISATIEEPELLPCIVCGRIIYCGASNNCFESNCPKQQLKE
jgi:hypothetical protein